MSFFGKLSGNPDERALESIARNLEAVLNAKRGHAGAVEVFGIGGYDGIHATKPFIGALSQEMLEQVKRHEPRLTEPQLTLIGRDRALWVRFRLSGRCQGEACSFAILFHSVFRSVRVLPAA
ncbi:GPW/gp25 family protein [Sorangium sp. So ce1014]|uniref:GPW/gp25 family protein n=1 Tax=unclassified Sorangium TaxID=2621164 RepID=UPI003F5FCCC3